MGGPLRAENVRSRYLALAALRATRGTNMGQHTIRKSEGRTTVSKLEALQESADKNKKSYQYDQPNWLLLETFTKPPGRSTLELHIQVPEFTSLCPITGQPDFATILIDYKPDRLCVESKSLKLYMMGYRNYGAFHEACVDLMAEHLIKVLDPLELKITGDFAARGGIPFEPTVSYTKQTTATAITGYADTSQH